MSTDADDAERRHEEWTALLAIYGEDAVDGAPGALEWRVSLGERCGWLEVHLPLDYPSRAPPAPVIIAPGLPDAPRAALALELHALHEAGAEVVFLWAEHLREAVPSLLLASRLASTDLSVHTADHAAAAAAAAAAEAAVAAEAAEPPRSAAPPTARYGLTFDPAACDAAHAVEITSGDNFCPSHGGAGETFRAHCAPVRSVHAARAWMRHGWMHACMLACMRNGKGVCVHVGAGGG